MRRRLWLLLPLAIVFAAASLRAADLIPTPEFTNHQLPQAHTPTADARADFRAWLDIGYLAVALGLASYFSTRARSRKGLFVLAIVSLAWLGFWRKGCVCPIGSIQNVAQAVGDSSYAVPLTVVVLFVLPLVFTLFFGRGFCAAVCPLGAMQELVAVRPVQVPTWLDQSLGLLSYIYLGAAVIFAATGTAQLICRYDPFVGMFRMTASFGMLMLGAGFLVTGVFIGRPYCRYLCPYGAILGMLSKLSKWHLKITPKNCIQCRLCEDACPYGAIHRPTVAPPESARRKSRQRLAAMLVLAPVLVAAFALLGRYLEGPLSELDPKVQLAERVRLEQTHAVTGTTDASDGFRNSGRPVTDLYTEARLIRHRLGVLGGWLGAWVGLVIGVKLIALSVRRRRTDYEPERASCVSCGRCFWYCPFDEKGGAAQLLVLQGTNPELAASVTGEKAVSAAPSH